MKHNIRPYYDPSLPFFLFLLSFFLGPLCRLFSFISHSVTLFDIITCVECRQSMAIHSDYSSSNTRHFDPPPNPSKNPPPSLPQPTPLGIAIANCDTIFIPYPCTLGWRKKMDNFPNRSDSLVFLLYRRKLREWDYFEQSSIKTTPCSTIWLGLAGRRCTARHGAARDGATTGAGGSFYARLLKIVSFS